MRGVKELLLALDPAVRMHQHGDTEAVVKFPEALLDCVAEIMRPRRSGSRTPPSAEARARGLRAIAERRESTSSRPPNRPQEARSGANAHERAQGRPIKDPDP
jgi:hypothetical protein